MSLTDFSYMEFFLTSFICPQVQVMVYQREVTIEQIPTEVKFYLHFQDFLFTLKLKNACKFHPQI